MRPLPSESGAPDADGAPNTSLAALIGEQSGAEAAKVVADAQEQAERIRAAARAEVQSIISAVQRGAEERGRRRAAELLAVAEAKHRMELLQVREALIDTALARARAQLAAFAGRPDAGRILARLIRQALAAFPPGAVRVWVASDAAALLDATERTALGENRWTLHFESGPVAGGGVIVETEDGRRRFDNSFDARIRRRSDQLRCAAAAALFQEHP